MIGFYGIKESIGFASSAGARRIKIPPSVAEQALLCDILVASVTVRSNEPDRLLLDYRFQWYDADDLKLITGSGEHWERVFVDGGEEEQVVGRATRPGATRAVFQIRYHQSSSAGN